MRDLYGDGAVIIIESANEMMLPTPNTKLILFQVKENIYAVEYDISHGSYIQQLIDMSSSGKLEGIFQFDPSNFLVVEEHTLMMLRMVL
jgi:hypothetical protein